MSNDYIDFKTGDDVPNWILKVKPKGVKRSLKFNVPFRVWRNDDGVVAQIMYQSDVGKDWMIPIFKKGYEERLKVFLGGPTEWIDGPVFYNVSFNYKSTLFEATCEKNEYGMMIYNGERGHEFR